MFQWDWHLGWWDLLAKNYWAALRDIFLYICHPWVTCMLIHTHGDCLDPVCSPPTTNITTHRYRTIPSAISAITRRWSSVVWMLARRRTNYRQQIKRIYAARESFSRKLKKPQMSWLRKLGNRSDNPDMFPPSTLPGNVVPQPSPVFFPHFHIGPNISRIVMKPDR